MKTRFIILLSVIMAAVVMSSCEKEQTPVFNPGIAQSSYSFSANGGTFSFPVEANVAWKVSSTESWIDVSPASASASESSTRTTVTVTVAQNDSFTDRTATVTVTGTGVGSSSFQVIQAGKDKKKISVTDKSGNTLSSIEAARSGEDIEVLVKSDAETISVSSADSWVTTSTASYTAGSTCTTKISVAKNTGSTERSTTVTFTGKDVESPVTVTINQKGQTSVSFTSVETNYHKCWVELEAQNESDLIGIIYSDKSFYDTDGAEGLADYQIKRMNSLINAYGADAVAEAFLDKGKAEYTLTDLEPETPYYIVAYIVEYDGSEFVLASDIVCKEFKTTAKPEAQKEYTSLLGDYVIKGKKVTVSGGTASVGEELTWPLTLEEDDINESYVMTILDNKFNPVYTDGSDTYVDTYVMGYNNDENGSFLYLPLFQEGSQGAVWSFQDVSGYCSIVLCGYDMTTLKADANFIAYGWNEDMTTLTQFYPENQYMIGTAVMGSDGSSQGFYSGLMQVTSIEKTEKSAATVARKSTKAHGTFEAGSLDACSRLQLKKRELTAR